MSRNTQEGNNPTTPEAIPQQNLETANEFEKATSIRVLVVEDQVFQQYNMVASLLRYYKDVIPNFRDGEDIKLIRSYEELQALLESEESINYDVVFLDNTVLIKPGYNPKGSLIGGKPKFDKDNLLLTGFSFYDEDGYNVSGYKTTDAYQLIGEFKKRDIVVVGTSSANDPELFQKFGQPDMVINKMDADPFNSPEENSLNVIKNDILAAIEKKGVKKDMERFGKTEQPAIAKLEVSQSPHGMSCIQVENPSARLRDIIRQAIMANHIDDLAYELRTDAGAFLQSDSDDYILVEFWKPDYQKFVDYLNEQISLEKNI